MYVYIYIYIYVDGCVYTYIYIYICMYTHIHIHMYIHMCIHTCVLSTCAHTHTHVVQTLVRLQVRPFKVSGGFPVHLLSKHRATGLVEDSWSQQNKTTTQLYDYYMTTYMSLSLLNLHNYYIHTTFPRTGCRTRP